jgi:hypothetical protein
MHQSTAPIKLHGLAILTPREAEDAGFESITTPIHEEHEKGILASVCRWRDPRRACLICVGVELFELALLRGDIAR